MSFKIGNIQIGFNVPLFVIAGPCVIESKELCLTIANKLAEISAKLNIGIIFKASFDKANRSSIKGFRGLGIDKGLEILSEVKRETGLSVLTDVHEPVQVPFVSEVVDCLQVPSFLCRQTDLLTACGNTGKPVNVKKGQFLSPAEMKNVVLKIQTCNNDKILLTERGTFFGYNRLVNDMTAIEDMKRLGCPVVFDATHSTQRPGGLGYRTSGRYDMAPILAKSAVAAGANGLFIEVHPNPEESKSDAGSIMPMNWLEPLLRQCKEIFKVVHDVD